MQGATLPQTVVIWTSCRRSNVTTTSRHMDVMLEKQRYHNQSSYGRHAGEAMLPQPVVIWTSCWRSNVTTTSRHMDVMPEKQRYHKQSSYGRHAGEATLPQPVVIWTSCRRYRTVFRFKKMQFACLDLRIVESLSDISFHIGIFFLLPWLGLVWILDGYPYLTQNSVLP